MSKLVSILIPTHNSALTLRSAIISCLNQSYDNIEIIVLDASSTDHTKEVVEDINNPKITFFVSNHNGIAAARNQLLKLAKGDYIAWLDADDLMMPHRIRNQVQFLEDNTEVDIVGTWIHTDSDELPSKELPTSHDEISTCLWFKNCMIQPSILSKNFYVKENIYYDESFANSAEDYELWYRLRNTKRFANLPEYQILYHMTTGYELIQKKENNHFKQNIQLLWQKKWQDIPVEVDDSVKAIFIEFIYDNFKPDSNQLKQLKLILKTLRNINKDPFFNLILTYHELRLWRNMGWMDRLNHLANLNGLRKWQQFKAHHLI